MISVLQLFRESSVNPVHLVVLALMNIPTTIVKSLGKRALHLITLTDVLFFICTSTYYLVSLEAGLVRSTAAQQVWHFEPSALASLV